MSSVMLQHFQPSIPYLNRLSLDRGLEPIPAGTGWEAGDTLDRSPVSHGADIKRESPINLTCMSLGCGRKYLVRPGSCFERSSDSSASSICKTFNSFIKLAIKNKLLLGTNNNFFSLINFNLLIAISATSQRRLGLGQLHLRGLFSEELPRHPLT